MPQKISMMVSTTSRYQPYTSPNTTPPQKVMAARPKGQTIGGMRMNIIERIRHTPSGCSSCGGR